MPRCAYPHIIKSTGTKCQKNAIADCMYCSQHNAKMNDEIMPDTVPPFNLDTSDNSHEHNSHEHNSHEHNSHQVQEDMNNALIAHLQEENKNLQNMVTDLTMRIQVLNITKSPNIDKKIMYRAKLIFYHENKNDPRIADFFKPLLTPYGITKAPWQFVMKLLKPEFDRLSHDEKNAYYEKAREYVKENLI